MKPLIAGILLIIGGIWARSHYTPIANLCHSGFGAFAQELSQTARQGCGTAQTAVTLAPWAIGLGAVLVGGSLLYVLGIVGSAAFSGSKKTQPGPR